MEGIFSSESYKTAISRATPIIERQSGRFGVISSSITVSGSPQTCTNGVPASRAASSTSRPEWSSPRSSSSFAQSMPIENSPRIFAFFSVMPHGSVVPTGAKGYFPPTSTFGAPQTTRMVSSAPYSTVHMRNLSAPGCGSICTTSPTTTPEKSEPIISIASTSNPAKVSLSANPSMVSSNPTYSFSQPTGTFINLLR